MLSSLLRVRAPTLHALRLRADDRVPAAYAFNSPLTMTLAAIDPGDLQAHRDSYERQR